MNKIKNVKKLVLLSVVSGLILLGAGCNRSSTGNNESDKALDTFNTIVNTYPDKKGFHESLQHWGFTLPSGEKFEWSKDMSANKADFALVMLADPLVKAGLDVTKLDKNGWIYEPAGKDEMGAELPNRLIKPFNVSDKKQVASGSEDSMRRLIKENNKLIKYHKEQMHYRLLLGENEVQWTEKLNSNNADMIFVLKAEPLVKAGLDVTKLEGSGWTFKPASEDDEEMGPNPDQIIRIYDLK